MKPVANFQEFYPLYLDEHRNPMCRRLHFVGSWFALVFIALAIWSGRPLYLGCALVCGYAFAWIGHIFFEKNKPATFQHPFYSFVGDWVMFKDILIGKVTI